MKRVLLTGGTGFIGGHALAPLAAAGYEICAAGRRTLSVPGVEWFACDLMDPPEVRRLLQRLRPSHLLHLAWYAEPRAYWTSAENFRWVVATQDLLEQFHRAGGVRAVAVGTCAEYGDSGDDCDEWLTPIQPATVYGKCKAAAGLLFHGWCQHAQLSGAWARIFHLYGPWEHPDRFVPSVCAGLLAGLSVQCTHGRQLRDFLHVQDVAGALVALLGSSVCGPVNIGDGGPVTVGEVAQRLGVLAGRPELLQFGARAAPEGEVPRLLPAVGRLRREVGWVPGYDLDSGLAATLEWWKMRGNPTAEAGKK